MPAGYVELTVIAAIVIMLVGFAISFWRLRKLERASLQARIGSERLQDQIQKLQSASDQARIAAEHLRDQILKMNAVQELDGAISNMEDIRRLPHLAQGPVLPEKYDSLKQELIAIRGRIPDLTDQQRSRIQGAIQQITNVENHVYDAIANGKAPALHRVNEIISKQVDQLGQILADLRTQIDRPER
jgi:hypothetical protein